jgi:hypothetical protein
LGREVRDEGAGIWGKITVMIVGQTGHGAGR